MSPRTGTTLLAFGDSLTAGYASMGTSFHPWAPLLEQLLGLAVADHVGFSGWRTGQMVDHLDAKAARDVCDRSWPGLRHKMDAAAAIGKPYQVVLILAGSRCQTPSTPPSAHDSVCQKPDLLQPTCQLVLGTNAEWLLRDGYQVQTTSPTVWHQKTLS